MARVSSKTGTINASMICVIIMCLIPGVYLKFGYFKCNARSHNASMPKISVQFVKVMIT